MKIGRREVGEIVPGCVDKKSQVFWGRRGTFSGAPPPRLSRSRPNFYTLRSLRSTLSLLSFIPLVEFWGSYAADPLFRIVTIWPAIYYMAGHNNVISNGWLKTTLRRMSRSIFQHR